MPLAGASSSRCLAPAAVAQETKGGDVALVVRPDVPVDNLTFKEVRELLLGDRQFWKGAFASPSSCGRRWRASAT